MPAFVVSPRVMPPQMVARMLVLIWLPLLSSVMFHSALGKFQHYVLLPAIPAVIALYVAALRRWRGSTAGMLGATLVCFWLLVAVSAPYLPLLDPDKPLAPLVLPGVSKHGVLFVLGT